MWDARMTGQRAEARYVRLELVEYFNARTVSCLLADFDVRAVLANPDVSKSGARARQLNVANTCTTNSDRADFSSLALGSDDGHDQR
jgi:hypothetical protein